jgi:hypothetical protein
VATDIIKDRPSEANPFVFQDDRRVEAFRLWITAKDRNDVSDMRKATRELRKSGISICVMAPPAGQGGVP